MSMKTLDFSLLSEFLVSDGVGFEF
jgi:hypothetical protein